MPRPSLADQLIDAQVEYVLAQLSTDALTATIERGVDHFLDAAGRLTVREAVDADAVKESVRRALDEVPSTAGTSEVVDLVLGVLYDGPAVPFTLGELVLRDQVEALVDELLGLTPVVERALDHLTESPLVGTVAARFMGRIVGEVLKANQAVADKVPGLGSLMALGTNAASRVMGAADKQFEAVLGDTAGKGATFAVRRLNAILLETLRDPTTREALLQIWDLAAEERVTGLKRFAEREELDGLVSAAHSVVATAAATEHVAAFADTLVDALLSRYGDHTLAALLDDFELTRDHLVAELSGLAPQVLEAAREDGALERIVRAEVEPFFRSETVTRILG